MECLCSTSLFNDYDFFFSKSPFHLSNRGWGDFPVRVQIFFKLKFNKPIHVTHDLKLDKSFTGRQTLGKIVLRVFCFMFNSHQVCAFER